MRIGILFGGRSREREISFAGGRTVYDLLDKSLFTPVPIFIDSLGNFIELDWQYLYKGSIRDFYPPVELEKESSPYQIYIESLNPDAEMQDKAIAAVGTKVRPEELKNLIDFAFLALHGPYGEDGSIQGMLDFYEIPYSGSGIFASAIGIDKQLQKELMRQMGIQATKSIPVQRHEWLNGERGNIIDQVRSSFQLPVVVKSTRQGSSIGVSILKDWAEFEAKVDRSFFTAKIEKHDWAGSSAEEKKAFIQEISDIYIGIGIPFKVDHSKVIYHPASLHSYVEEHFSQSDEAVFLESLQTEPEIIIEEFINGKEFSCIVVEGEHGEPIALPPTEIIKSSSIFDYRAKYLPGISRKVTPINLPEDTINDIRSACEKMYEAFHFNVYARIDGLISKDGRVFLNDPNTTSGMLPSSFFFHQAAEIGLSPTQFLSYIIYKSIQNRLGSTHRAYKLSHLLNNLDEKMQRQREGEQKKFNISVVLGGISSERHISVESGRNVFEKLSSSGKYKAMPLFLAQEDEKFRFFKLPLNLLLKDNADDIREKTGHFITNPVIKQIIDKASWITGKFASKDYEFIPQELSLDDIKHQSDAVFIGLHGRPGEDGTLQQLLDAKGIPYNGSSPGSSSVTINKYLTNEILRSNGFLIPEHVLVKISDWKLNADEVVQEIEKKIKYPLIAKPADDGCSSAVKKVNNRQELISFVEAIFRPEDSLSDELRQKLGLKPNEEFPCKDFFVVEEMVSPNGAKHFIEITGGLLTHYDGSGNVRYEMFEPSEALAQKGILSLEEKFLAGEGQNITPARFATDEATRLEISNKVQLELKRAAEVLKIEGYCRIDAFVRIFSDNKLEVIFIEVNSLPGLTPATCIFHQAALNGYKPAEFLDKIIDFGVKRLNYMQEHA